MLKFLTKLEEINIDKMAEEFKRELILLKNDIQDMKFLLEGINTNLRLILSELKKR